MEIARALYKPSPKVETLVLKIMGLFDKPLSNGVTINGLRFDNGYLKISGTCVRMVVRSEDHCGIEVHWEPNFQLSTTSDPFCSAFILRYNSLLKLYREVEKVLSTMRAN